MVRLPTESLFSGEIDVAEPNDRVADYPATTLETGGMQHHRNVAMPTRWRTSALRPNVRPARTCHD
jgi:hypothetical protein